MGKTPNLAYKMGLQRQYSIFENVLQVMVLVATDRKVRSTFIMHTGIEGLNFYLSFRHDENSLKKIHVFRFIVTSSKKSHNIAIQISD